MTLWKQRDQQAVTDAEPYNPINFAQCVDDTGFFSLNNTGSLGLPDPIVKGANLDLLI